MHKRMQASWLEATAPDVCFLAGCRYNITITGPWRRHHFFLFTENICRKNTVFVIFLAFFFCRRHIGGNGLDFRCLPTITLCITPLFFPQPYS